jgi:RNA polymerase sigma-70 factor (ECF subfamily)
MASTPDGELVQRTRRGEAAAYGELVTRYQQMVFNVCYRMLGERRDAEDLAQESFIRAFRRLDSFDAERPFGPWMRRLATNLCLNHLARKRLQQVELEEERQPLPAKGQPGPESAQLRREQSERIRAAIADLPPHYRAVIELRHFQELTYVEIAETLDIPLSNVKSHLFRARRALADSLADE